MKRLACAAFLALLFVASAALSEEKPDKSTWPSLTGVYTGTAEVFNERGHMIPSDVRVEIRKGQKNFLIMEMYYFNSKVAKFTQCARTDKFKLSISEDVTADDRKVHITGLLESEDGKTFEGAIRYDLADQEGETTAFRTFKLHSLIQSSPK